MVALGIDFGTATTVAATCIDGDVQVVDNPDGQALTPSTVSFVDQSTVEVGSKANARRAEDPTNTLYSLKRVIGRQWSSPVFKDFSKRYPFEVVQGKDGAPLFVTRAGELTPAAVVAHLFEYVTSFRSVSRRKIERVRVAVPTSFTQPQLDALQAALPASSFPNLDLMDEAHAAVLPYFDADPGGEVIAVCDFGAGSFKVAVLQHYGIDCEVLASGGNPFLGGDDIDQQIADLVADRILEHHSSNVRSTTGGYQALLYACETAKVRLSSSKDATLALGSVDPSLEGAETLLELDDVAPIYSKLLERATEICTDTLSAAGLEAADLDAVVVAGGGANIATLHDGIAEHFGMEPKGQLASDQIVAMGAAIRAQEI